MQNKKITIVGAGNVGSQAALFIAMKGLGDVVLVDVLEGIPQGKALDIQQTMPLLNSDSKVIGTNNYEETKNSDVVVVTAGIARKPGMTREDLIGINSKIVKQVVMEINKHSKNYILIIVTNPLDAMTYLAYNASKLPKERVMGMAGVLDSTRFTSILSKELNEKIKNINCIVVGSHGEGMVPLINNSYVNNKPLNSLFDEEKLIEIINKVKNGGLEIVSLLKTGSAFFAPGASISIMVESIIKDQKRMLPCTAYLNGQYGVKDIFLGVPVKLGNKGVEEIIELELSDKEKEEFMSNASNVKKQIELLDLN